MRQSERRGGSLPGSAALACWGGMLQPLGVMLPSPFLPRLWGPDGDLATCGAVGQCCGARLGLVACVGPWVSPCPWDVGAVVHGKLLGFCAPCASPGPDSNRAQLLPGDTEQVLWDRGGQGSSRGAPRSLQSRARLAVTHLAGAEQFGVCCASVTPAGDEYVASFFFLLLFFFPPWRRAAVRVLVY